MCRPVFGLIRKKKNNECLGTQRRIHVNRESRVDRQIVFDCLGFDRGTDATAKWEDAQTLLATV